ncbi:MAG TPA: glycosyltransferase [Bacteroidales bacterium]|nr:glycosyltransferase [Bacteroidales bacterium]
MKKDCVSLTNIFVGCLKPVYNVSPIVLRALYVFFPYGSRRWMLLKSAFRILRHPWHYVKSFKWQDFGGYIRALFNENRIQYDRKATEALNPGKETMAVAETAPEMEDSPGERLQIPDHEQPEILFIYAHPGSANSLFNSIKSLVQTVSIPYRIILSGDCREFAPGQALSGIRYLDEQMLPSYVLHHPSLHSIGLLDGDSVLQPETVQTCLTTLGRDKKTGMVVPRVLVDQYTLESAGAILWNDGVYTRYGQGGDPGAPEFNYLKEVDSSDHFAVVDRELLLEWIQDAPLPFSAWPFSVHDLAMKSRASEKKVVYQPLARLLLGDQQQNTSGIQASELFCNRWKTQLEKHHLTEGPENVFIARERGQDRQYLLMIDYNVPMYDVSAGSRTMQCYIQLFTEKGYLIKFVSDYFYPPARLVSPMEQQGTEVLHGAFYEANLRQWLSDNGKNFSVIFLSRPVIADKYLGWVKEFTTGKIIYYGHDLHYLRAFRRYELERGKGQLKEAERFRAMEKKLFESCDVIYYPSQSEIDILRSEFHITRPVRAIVPYIYDAFPQRQADWSKKKGILFLGGFHHPPNVDAVNWFLNDIWPEVAAQLPGIQFYIAGSDPPEAILERQSETIRVVGLVSDEELEILYETCRLVVAPLRYGAGLKGKIVEAMYYGMPVVTTTIGAEGLDGARSILQVADEAEAFARKIIGLYENEGELQKLAEASVMYVRDNFSKEKAYSIIQNDLEDNP